MRAPNYTELRDRVESMGFRFFAGAHNPNLAGVRNRSREAGPWDDLLLLAYEDGQGRGVVHSYQGTTDPSDVWLQSERGHPRGTAILVPQQARGCWAVGPGMRGINAHRYPCFRQVAPMAFVRDANRDAVLDVDDLIVSGMTESGIRGFDGHRASAHRLVPSVGLYGAGCQVWRDPGEFAHALDFVTWSSQWYGDRVTYTLLDQWMD